MIDELPDAPGDAEPQTLTCDVCIVGAGIAGLNALAVAIRYLAPGQRIVLVDRRNRPGGMWVDTYPYVRLHQPHRLFTAGDIPWPTHRDRAHLASRSEVIDYFAHCLAADRRGVVLDEFYGCNFDGAHEGPNDVRVTCSAPRGRRLEIRAAKLIKAFGADVTPNDPLPLQSSQVRSVAPDSPEFDDRELRDGTAPVWIVGGGKTGMDTAHRLLVEDPDRTVHLIAGEGTYFINRDQVLPRGWRRWWAGRPMSAMGTQFAARFDGHNEDAVAQWHRATYGLSIGPRAANFKFGLLSPAEAGTISAGIDTIVMGHFSDVVDTDAGPVLLLRDGTRIVVEAGSWIVNCTGYLFQDGLPQEPYVSPGGRVVTISLRSATHFTTSHVAYFLTHLLMLDLITTVPLYQVDVHALSRLSKPAFTAALMSTTLYNLSLIADAVPKNVFAEFGGDFDRWFPWHRRVKQTATFLLTHRRRRRHWKAALDAMGERFPAACGPLPRPRPVEVDR